MSYLEILLLAVVQGITEFLPISSSGHLVIVEALLGHQKELLDVNIVLHGGTLLSILVYYWHHIWRLLGKDRRAIGLILLATIPVVVVGFPMKEYGEAILSSPLVAGLMLPVTGALLLWAARRPQGDVDYPEMSYGRALVVGLFQVFAILPGISRSGTTISGGLAVGLKRESATTFAFLLGIPTIGGAVMLTLVKLLKQDAATSATATPIGVLAVGFVTSFLVGLVALWWLIRWLEKGRLAWFAYWCIAVGAAVIIWQVAKLLA